MPSIPAAPLAVWLSGVVLAGIATMVANIAVPILVAVIMGGPAWYTAKTARKEALTVSGLIVERLERIESSLSDFSIWRAAHEALLDSEVAELIEKVEDHLQEETEHQD